MYKQPAGEQARVDDKTRFNMDIAFQETLHRLLAYSSSLGLNGDPKMRFSVIREIRIMITSILSEEKIKEHDVMRDALKNKIALMGVMMAKKGIWFQNGTYYRKGKYNKTKINKEFYDLVDDINENLDNWEQKIRIDMAAKGFFLLKIKTGSDAAGEV